MSTKSKHLIILVGNIGSGKSTYVKKYQEEGYVVISRDSLRYGIGGGKYIFNRYYEHIIWETELSMFNKFLELEENIIVDEIGLNRKLRNRYILYAKEKGYSITIIEMPIFSMKESVDRRMTNPHCQNDRNLWNTIWESFNVMYDAPNFNEGIDEIIKVGKNEVS